MQHTSPLAFISSLLVPRNTISILHLNYCYYVAMTPIIIIIYKGIDYFVSSKESQNVYNGSYPPKTPRLMIPTSDPIFLSMDEIFTKYAHTPLLTSIHPALFWFPAEKFQYYYIISLQNLNLLLLDFW